MGCTLIEEIGESSSQGTSEGYAAIGKASVSLAVDEERSLAQTFNQRGPVPYQLCIPSFEKARRRLVRLLLSAGVSSIRSLSKA